MKGFRMKKNALFLMLILFFIGCKKKRESELFNFFEKLSEKIEDRKLESFRSTELDSAGIAIEFISNDLENCIDNTEFSPRLKEFSGFSNYDIPTNTKKMYLGLAFHLYLNNIPISYSTMKTEVSKINEFSEENENNICTKRKLEIIKHNDNRFQIGDTVNVSLPYTETLGILSTVYYSEILLDTDYFELHEILNISGTILEKRFNEENYFDDLRFLIKILKLSNDTIPINGVKPDIGDTIDFSVSSYYREIGSGLGDW